MGGRYEKLIQTLTRSRTGRSVLKLRLPLNATCGMLRAMVLEQLDDRSLSMASSRVAKAFAFSLLLHLALFLTIELGHQTGWWKATFLFAKEQARLDAQASRVPQQQKTAQADQEIPLVFIDVDPSQATPDSPAEAKYYSALNSKAANPDTHLDKPTPKIDGKQERVPQTVDRAHPVAQPLQPTPPPQPQVVQERPKPEPAPPKEEVKPQEAPAPAPLPRVGDLAFSRPTEKPLNQSDAKKTEATEQAKPAHTRPRRLAEVRPPKTGLAGERMKQAGGARRFSVEPAFDVKATPFGSYDAAIIAAIQQHWYNLLDAREFAGTYSGKVVVEFRLNSDGHVSDVKISESDVSSILTLLCQRAVQDPAPFARWPPDLRRLVGKDFREVRFTFYYN